MKTLMKSLFAICLLTFAFLINPLHAQNDYKHPQINSAGRVLDEKGIELGWIKNGIVYNAKGEMVATIQKQELFDSKGKKLGKLGKDGTLYDAAGAVVFTIEPNSKGEKCKVFDAQGKVIATVHESYKNQACAIHCLYKKMQAH